MSEAERTQTDLVVETPSHPTPVPPVTPEDHVLGPDEAGVTLIEYGEFECPHCGRAHFQLKNLRDRLPELGVRFVFRHLARDEVHPFAVRAAVAAEAAGRQDLFWSMHDHLFEHQHSLEYDDLRRHAEEVGLDIERFRQDFRDPELLRKVKAQGAAAVRSGVDGTPTFFLNGKPYEGSYEERALIKAIQREADAATS